MGADHDVLQEILAAEEEGRRRVEIARGEASARLTEARRESEEYRLSLLDSIAGRLSSLDLSLSEEFDAEAGADDRRTGELIAAIEQHRDHFEEQAAEYLRKELFGGR
jgi:hypothetical protein